MTKIEKSERRKTIIKILTKGVFRVVDSLNKSSDISKLEQNKDSQFVAYRVDIDRDKSVCEVHEN